MSQLWQRREHRVDYETTVRLFPSQESEAIEGCTTNLSESGVFVNAATLCDVGTELLCDLELPSEADEQRLTVHGRVAWVYEPRSGQRGMGIEFVGLTEPDTSALRDLAGPPREEVRQLDVWFDGVEQPVRVEALPSDTGVKFRTSLPFLQLGSGVSFGGSELGMASRRGMLHAVELMLDPTREVPFLELTVSPSGSPDPQEEQPLGVGPIIPGKMASDTLRMSAPPHEESVGDPARTDEVPEAAELLDDPSDEVVGASPAAPGLPQVAGQPTDEQPEHLLDEAEHEAEVEDELEAELEDELEAELEDELEADEAADDDADDRSQAREDASACAAGESTGAAQLELDLARERMASSLSGQIDLASELVLQQGADGALAEAYDDADARDETSATAVVPSPSSRRPQTWLWLSGLALCALILSWTIHAGFWANVGESDRAGPGAAAAGQSRSQSADLDSDSKARSGSPEQHAAASPTGRVVEGAGGPGRRAAGQDLAQAALDRPRLQRFGAATVLTVPIKGTTDGVKHYEMTDPPGLVVKLPRAAPRLPSDDYRINAGGFGVVWVRRGDVGWLLRFHFTAKRLQHTLTLGNDRVAVTLSPGV